jgi:hypothetical protein
MINSAIRGEYTSDIIFLSREDTKPLWQLFEWWLGECIEIVRFEVFTAVIMKNAIFWDIKAQFVPHRKHITSPLRSLAG